MNSTKTGNSGVKKTVRAAAPTAKKKKTVSAKVSKVAQQKTVGAKRVKVRLIKSLIGRLPKHRNCLYGLGLRRIGQQVEVLDTPANRGMINKVHYLLELEE